MPTGVDMGQRERKKGRTRLKFAKRKAHTYIGKKSEKKNAFDRCHQTDGLNQRDKVHPNMTQNSAKMRAREVQ